jgi:Uma2 family endonuclease
MSALLSPQYLSVAEYLAGEQISDVKHEYVGGSVYAMAGTTRTHNSISLRLATRLGTHLGGGPCQTYVNDVKVRLLIRGEDLFYYPDLMVGCDPRDTDELWLRFPKLIIEVLSPSTERLDRREKFWSYITIPTLEEYVLVAQESPAVTIHRRRTDWQPEAIVGLDSTFHLESVDLTLPLRALYENVRDAA